MKIATYNLAHSRRAIGIFGAYSWENREPYLINLIDKVNPDILCVQEINQEKTEEFIKKNNKYHWFTEPQNARGGKFTNIGICVTTRIDPNDIEWISYNSIRPTASSRYARPQDSGFANAKRLTPQFI